MTDKPTTIVSSTFTPGDGPMPTAWEAHAAWLLEALAGLRVQGRAQEEKTPRNAFVVSSSMVAFHWAQQTVLGGRTDVSMADAFLRAAELLVRVVETVRPFLETRGLLERVTGERKSWAPDDTGELVYSEGPVEVERLRLDPFFGPADAEGRREALLETVNVDGEAHELLVFDARLADLLEELGQAGWAAKARSTPAEERGRRWIDLENHKPLAAMAVCKAVWRRIQAEGAAPGAKLLQVTHLGAAYVQVPKVLGGIAWAFGTSGEVVDGDRYQAAPNVTRYVSRSIGLVPDGRIRQGLLSVDVAEEALAVRVLTDTQAVVSGVGGKVALLLSVAARADGGLCKMTVAELCRALWPDVRRIQKRDRERALQAVRQLRALAVVLPNGVDFPLWQIAAPDVKNPDPDLEVTFGWSTLATADELGGKVASMLRGGFMLNFDGAMRLSGDHALELRTYVHAAAGWNEARRGDSFEAKFAPKGTPDELAARVNALSAPALEHLREHGKGRKQSVADDRARMRLALERLEDEAGLIRLEKVGRDTYALLPPEAFLEAHRLMREHGRRPAK